MANVPGLAGAAAKYGVPYKLAESLVRQESGGNQNAKSTAGAIGYTQLMPATAQSLGVDPTDPQQNLEGGMKYLSQMFKQFGSWQLALAAYNAGPGAVQKAGGIPDIPETQNYVKSIMGMMGGPGSISGVTPPPGAPINGSLATPVVQPLKAPMNLQQLMAFSAPSAGAVNLLKHTSPMAGAAAESSQQAIPLPAPMDTAPAAQSTAPAQQQTDPYQINAVPHQSQMAGHIPMVTGGNIAQKYPNLRAMSQVDWQHVNPRLLEAMNNVAAKQGSVIVLNSGYRSDAYSKTNGGFVGDPHTKGVAVDAYVNGHPVGDVIPPEVWAKLGIRSGNTPGFYQGKPDPEHLDLIGIPVKGGTK